MCSLAQSKAISQSVSCSTTRFFHLCDAATTLPAPIYGTISKQCRRHEYSDPLLRLLPLTPAPCPSPIQSGSQGQAWLVVRRVPQLCRDGGLDRRLVVDCYRHPSHSLPASPAAQYAEDRSCFFPDFRRRPTRIKTLRRRSCAHLPLRAGLIPHHFG